jgi:hypothetical protein
MPATAIPVFTNRKGYLYDGTNSADLAAAIDDFTVVTEDAANLTFNSGGVDLVVPRGGYVVAQTGKVAAEDIFANADDFHDANTEFGEVAAHVHDLKLTTTVGMPAPATEGEG